MNLIEFHHVDFWYDPEKPILTDLSFSVPENLWTVIYGETGCGKTTVVRLIMNLCQAKRGRILRNFAANNYPGYIMQNPDDQISQVSVERELVFPLENRGMPVAEIRKRVSFFLDRFDLRNKANLPPYYLSGGEKQRLALASLLIGNPGFLILDEPVSFLDVDSQINFLRSLQSIEGLTVLWLTQEEDEISLGDNVVILENGGNGKE